MLSSDLRSLAGVARGEAEMNGAAREALALRLDAAADRAAAIEAAVVPAAARRQARDARGPNVVRLAPRTDGAGR